MTKDRTSIIFKLNFKNKWYICNRHSDSFKNLLFPNNQFTKSFSTFWNWKITNPVLNNHDMLRFFTANDIKILEIVDCENYNREDQKIINEIKRKYIDNYKILDGQNLTDNCLNTELPKYRKQAEGELKKITAKFFSIIYEAYTNNREELNKEIINTFNELVKDNYVNVHVKNIIISLEQEIPWELIYNFNKRQNEIKIYYNYDKGTNIYYPLVLGKALDDDKLNQLFYFKTKKQISHISASKKFMEIPLGYVLFEDTDDIKKCAWALIRHYFNNNYNIDNNQNITTVLYNDFFNDKYLQYILK